MSTLFIPLNAISDFYVSVLLIKYRNKKIYMIKNWVVTTRQIQHRGIKYDYDKVKKNGRTKYLRKKETGKRVHNGFINHAYYLRNNNSPSHALTKISVLLDNEKNIFNANIERDRFRYENKLKGAKHNNFASSFVLTIPRSLKNQPTKSDFIEISKRVIKDVSSATGLSVKVLKQHIHIVLHDESAIQGKASHIHVLVSNVIDAKVVKSISQFKTTYAIKKGLNESLKVLLNEDHMDYVPITKKKKNVPLWLARQEKKALLETQAKGLGEEINKQKLKLLKVNKIIALLAKKLTLVKADISVWADDFLNNYFIQAEEKARAVAKIIDDIEFIAEEQVVELDETVRKVEERNKSAPVKAKISSNRKRRRRKNKHT
jgi:hypothetical protein